MRTKKPKIKKKGSMIELVIIVPIIFMIFVVLLFVKTGYNEMKPELSSEIAAAGGDTLALNKADTVVNGMNYLFPIIILLAIVVIIMLAVYTETSPMFLFMGVIVFLISLSLAIMFKEGAEGFISEGELANATSTYGGPVFIMSNLPFIIAVAGIIIGIAIYAKSRSAEGGI